MDEIQEEIEWLQQINKGSKKAFDFFYEKYNLFVFNIAYQITGNKTEAEDICHDVFLEIFQKAHEYNANKGSIKAWLAVRTKSRSIDRLRKKKPLLIQKLESLPLQTVQGADLIVLKEIETKLIQDALKHIPQAQREAIYRSYFKGDTHSEIAKKMKKPLGSVKSLIRYGINNLRKQKTIIEWIHASGGENKDEAPQTFNGRAHH